MKCLLGMMVGAGCLVALGAQPAWAQGGGVPRPGIGQVTTPAYSPYLNLFRNSPVYQNYYGLTRPELEFRSDVQGLQQQVSTNDQAIGGIQAAGTISTGHTTRFLSTGRYFLNSAGAAKPGKMAAGGGSGRAGP
jgi:hypothetical protein